jgi:hypothetical protein
MVGLRVEAGERTNRIKPITATPGIRVLELYSCTPELLIVALSYNGSF